MKIGEKVAYLKGLAEGLELDVISKEGKIITGIIDTLELISDKINKLDEDQKDLQEYVDNIEDDLSGIEDALSGQKHQHSCCHGNNEFDYYRGETDDSYIDDIEEKKESDSDSENDEEMPF